MELPTSLLGDTPDSSTHPTGDQASAVPAAPEDNQRDQPTQASQWPARPGALSPVDRGQEQRGTSTPADLLATLIEQMKENWDHGDDAANDELVLRIREHIRQHRATNTGKHINRDA